MHHRQCYPTEVEHLTIGEGHHYRVSRPQRLRSARRPRDWTSDTAKPRNKIGRVAETLTLSHKTIDMSQAHHAYMFDANRTDKCPTCLTLKVAVDQRSTQKHVHTTHAKTHLHTTFLNPLTCYQVAIHLAESPRSSHPCCRTAELLGCSGTSGGSHSQSIDAGDDCNHELALRTPPH
jgi:hypothetical protein